jgi:hypothetical protein
MLSGLLITQGYSQKIFKKANKQYELKAYKLAITNYQKSLKEENPNNGDAILNLAECYRRTNQPIEAVSWYRKIGKEIVSHPSYYLNYAHTLKSIGKYNEAQEIYWNYKQHNPIVGEHFALSCDFAISNLMEEEAYDLRLFGGNSKYSDFGVSFYNGKVVFSSFRKSLDGVVGDRNDNQIQAKSKNRLVYSVSDNPSMRDPLNVLRDALKNDENLGPISYASDMTRCAYTKNSFKNGFDFVGIDDNNLSLYLATANTDGDFVDEVPFKHNEVGYATGFPCLAFSGDALYFSSNRPGGFGGYDIYVSYFKDNDWTYPENLGGQVNTSGNEITPFFDGRILYFSSDYHQGLGGFDIFRSKVIDGGWTFAENMGNGVNSLSDDYFFSVNPRTKDYYLSSNRLGGRGKDDIYIATPVNNDDIYAATTEVPAAVDLHLMQKPSDVFASDASVVSSNVDVPTVYKIDESKVPPAVDLTNTDYKKENNSIEAVPVSTASESIPKRVKISDVIGANNAPKRVKLPTEDIASNNTNLDASTVSSETTKVKGETKARLLAINQILAADDDVYFIQVAALFKNRVNLDEFKNLTEYGNLYKVFKSSSTKIRLGYYMNRSEAESMLRKVRQIGYKDAFIAHEPLNIHEVQLAMESDSYSDPYASNYKIRLASYEDPQFFDLESVKTLGKVEQWTKKGWTIFVLSGYRSLEDAEAARVKAINKGYTSAEIVIDNGGILEKLVKN